MVSKKIYLALLILFLVIHANAKIFDLPESIKVTAQEFQYDLKKKNFIASGNVQINSERFYLQADQVSYDINDGIISAEGNIFYKDKYISLRAERAILNTIKKTGELTKATILISQDNVVIHADEIKRISENDFVAHNASYTTCNCTGSPAWAIRSKEFKIELGKTAFAKDLFFEIKGVPVLYLPVGAFPVKTERDTGFLPPRFTYLERDGIITSIPYYIVFGRSSDLTITPEYLSKRGAGGKVELRYVNSPLEKGEIALKYLNEFMLEDRRQRWVAQIHHSSFTPKYYHLIDINLISDKDYFADFGEVLENQGVTYTESKISLTRYTSHSLLTGSIIYYQDIINAGSDKPVYNRLPYISYTLFPRYVPLLYGYFSFNLTFNNFVTELNQFAYQRSFKTKSALLSGEPEFNIPLRLGRFLDFNAQAKLTSKLIYVAGLETELNPRNTPELQINASSNIRRYYGELRHTIVPGASLFYSGETKGVIDIIQYDSPEVNLFSVYLKNFLVRTELTGDEFKSSEVLQLVLIQNFFLNGSQLKKNVYLTLTQSGDGYYVKNLFGQFTLKAWSPLTLGFRSSFNEEIKEFTFYNLNGTYIAPWNTIISADYKYTRVPYRNEEAVGSIQQTIGGFRLTLSERYSIISKKLTEGLYELHYTSKCKCWYVTFGFIDKPGYREDRFNLLFNLIGLGF